MIQKRQGQYIDPAFFVNVLISLVSKEMDRKKLILFYKVRALHNLYFLKEDGLFFSSEALGLVFSATYLWGSFALFPLSAGFPPLISCEKTAPLRQSLQKSPPSFLGLQRLSGCAKTSR